MISAPILLRGRCREVLLLACGHLMEDKKFQSFPCQVFSKFKSSPQPPLPPPPSPPLQGRGRRTGRASPNRRKYSVQKTTQTTAEVNRGIATSQGKSLEIDPLSLSTSLARSHHISPMLLEPLLLHGTAMSMNLVGESMLHSATIGMLA